VFMCILPLHTYSFVDFYLCGVWQFYKYLFLLECATLLDSMLTHVVRVTIQRRRVNIKLHMDDKSQTKHEIYTVQQDATI
jgi:hypothetical protein